MVLPVRLAVLNDDPAPPAALVVELVDVIVVELVDVIVWLRPDETRLAACQAPRRHKERLLRTEVQVIATPPNSIGAASPPLSARYAETETWHCYPRLE
jgi:hypothetical protein